jgi:D-alanyl-D-alanine dipeptidase
MLMAVSMPWAASKRLAAAVVLAPLLVGVFTFFITGSVSPETTPVQLHYCFEERSVSIETTTLDSCPVDLISLGSGPLTESATVTGNADEVHPILLNRFTAAKIAGATEGVKLFITSGFRSEERQGQLFAEAIKKYGSESEAAKWVLPPRYSHHPEGLALDINYPGDRAGARWLDQNGFRFGLCRVYVNEWWHFEAVSEPGEKCPAMAPNALIDMQSGDEQVEDLG